MSPTLPQIQIEGRSGCRLEIMSTNNLVLVRKFASNQAYNTRLKKQEQKQAAFNTVNMNNLGFYSPEVVNNGMEQDLYWFDMHYAGGEKYSNHLTRINKDALDQLIEKFIAYLKQRIAESKQTPAPRDIIHQKIADLSVVFNQQKGIPQLLNNQIIEYLNSSIPDNHIYVGNCHGDFTLSNMLFTLTGKIITFDLLDSFIESPIIDLVKLRQDTKYHWSLFVENTHFFNTVKIKQVLAYMDKHIVQAFENDEHIATWEKYLTVFNFARILPYAKDERDIQYLSTHLTTILNL